MVPGDHSVDVAIPNVFYRLKLQKFKSNEIQFSYRLLPVMLFETTNLRTHGSMHFVETMKIGVDE
jgi:hypothetical protein